RRLARVAVQRVDRQARRLVHAGLDPRLRRAPDPVLRREQRDQLQLRHRPQQVNGRPPLPVHARMVGDEAHALAPYDRGRVLHEDLDAGPHDAGVGTPGRITGAIVGGHTGHGDARGDEDHAREAAHHGADSVGRWDGCRDRGVTTYAPDARMQTRMHPPQPRSLPMRAFPAIAAALACACSLLLAACAGAPRPADRIDRTTTLIPAAPASVGMSADLNARLDSIVTTALAEGAAPGAVL